MARKKGSAAGNGKGKGKAAATRSAVPDVYREMLAEALPLQPLGPDRPLKKRKFGLREVPTTPSKPIQSVETDDQDEEDNIEFEDVLDQNTDDALESSSSHKLQQTAYRDSDDESEEDDFEWEGIDFDATPDSAGPSGDLELTLTKKPAPKLQLSTPRRKPVTKAERVARLDIHKMHILCLLSYLDRRNNWCNDLEVQKLLKPLIDKKMLKFLKPRSDLSQFSRADSLKRGLEHVSVMWRTKFNVTERGLRRALWAEKEDDLINFRLPDDTDSVFEKSDFQEAAESLQGSRDTGAQLYCALLRSVEVEARLVCSLQPLPFTGGGPSLPRTLVDKVPIIRKPESTTNTDAASTNTPIASGSRPAAPGTFHRLRRRLGNSDVEAYVGPEMRAPALPKLPKPKIIRESPFPVFWVEVFEEAHQKWHPVDPLVTESVAKPRLFEPPAVDRENSMTYVIAFEEEGCARDVTRRYTKAYNAKTRRGRVESTPGGEKWWKRTMRTYDRGFKSDADQIEDSEFAAAEAREPMPKNVIDFKDHPYYALERHLKRNEVLVATHAVGKIAAGRDPSTPGGKKMESVYRRRDVKIARSADAWYRQGREIKMGEQPLKTVAAKRRPDEDDMGDEGEERPGTNLYSEEQTELYESPPIINGRVPKNSFGNLDVFVPSMVPKGGVHIPDPEASRAARILGIDYSDALTGFEFRGRRGTAVLKGIVVATEYGEAVEAVIEGFRDERAAVEEQMRSLGALRMWRRFLMALRIKQRVDAYAVEGEDEEPAEQSEELPQDDDGDGMESEEYEYDDDGGGGFFPE